MFACLCLYSYIDISIFIDVDKLFRYISESHKHANSVEDIENEWILTPSSLSLSLSRSLSLSLPSLSPSLSLSGTYS